MALAQRARSGKAALVDACTAVQGDIEKAKSSLKDLAFLLCRQREVIRIQEAVSEPVTAATQT